MSDRTIRTRDEVPAKYTWNAPSVFESPEAWQEAFEALTVALEDVDRYRGHLCDGVAVLADALDLLDALSIQAGKLSVYSTMSHAVNMEDQDAAKMSSQARGIWAQLAARTAFLEPELLAIGQETLEQWICDEPRLSKLGHFVDDLFRKQAHIRSAEVEEILGMVGDPFSGAQSIAGILTNADFEFRPAENGEGQPIPLMQGTLGKILAGSDRKARQTAWENYTDEYLAHKRTLAASLATSVKQCVFRTRARRHTSTLAATLFEHNIPIEVFHNLVATFRKHLPTWHRYWAIRRAALGMETLHPYDIWAPLTGEKTAVPYEQAVDWICDGLAPMGESYVQVLRRGALEDRWVDVYPNQGKRAGAFSTGRPGTFPFIMMSYNDNVLSMSTLAHELGHSMHSYLTWQNQPVVYSHYSLFVAEVASNFHQAMVRAFLLDQSTDPSFQIEVIEEAMSNFHRYFFIMPTLARFELEIHERAERGQGLTAEDMNALMCDLFAEGYGGEMNVDPERVGITWATFGHLYIDYYVYQYATGISGANALAKRILSGAEGAVDDYLAFLGSGSSKYPLDVLKMAGVDLTNPEPVEIAFDVLSEMVDRLESLIQ